MPSKLRSLACSAKTSNLSCVGNTTFENREWDWQVKTNDEVNHAAAPHPWQGPFDELCFQHQMPFDNIPMHTIIHSYHKHFLSSHPTLNTIHDSIISRYRSVVAGVPVRTNGRSGHPTTLTPKIVINKLHNTPSCNSRPTRPDSFRYRQ